MAEEKKVVAFKVVVDNSDLDRSAAAAAERVDELKEKQKQLDRTTDSGRIAYQKYSAEIKKAQGDLRKYTDLQKKNIIATESAEGSNEQLRAQLSLVTAEYNKLSAEQRENSEAGKALGNQVAELTAKLKENESAVGDNRRNVGNYEEAIRNATGEMKVNSAFTDKNRQANLELQGQMEATARSTAAIAGGFALLSQLIGDNEKAQNALKVVTLAVAAATVAANIAKEKGAILDSIAFAKTKLLTASQAAYNLVIGAGTVAMKAFRAALAATGIGAVIVGITLLISRVKSFTNETESAADMQKRLNDELERERDIIEEVQSFLDDTRSEQISAIERQIELRKAQGATEVELSGLEIELLQQKLEFTRQTIQETLTASGQEDRYSAALQAEKQIVNDLAIAQIERNKLLKEQREEQEAYIQQFAESEEVDPFGFTNVQDILDEQEAFFESIGMQYENFAEGKVRAEQEAADAISEMLRKQDEEAEQFFIDNAEREAKRREDIQRTADIALQYSTQIGQIFADSITEAGFQAEDFARRLAVLGIDALEKSLLAAIAEITFKQIASKGFAGIATTAILTSVVTGAANIAKNALSKPVKFEQGGEYDPFGVDVGGRLHSQGGTKYFGEDGNVIELERGEKMFVTNRKTSSLLKGIAALNMSMGGRGMSGSSSFLADGGFASRGVVDSVNGQFNTAQLASDIVRSLPAFQVSVSEINRVQNRVSVTDSVTSI